MIKSATDKMSNEQQRRANIWLAIISIAICLCVFDCDRGVIAAPQEVIFNFSRLAEALAANSNTNFNVEIDDALAASPTATDQTAPGVVNNLPSDITTNINLLPINNLIAAAAIAEVPAPTQFIRTAMNSGLRR